MVGENQYAHKASRSLDVWISFKGATEGCFCDKQTFFIVTEAFGERLQVKEAGDSEDSEKGADDDVVPAPPRTALERTVVLNRSCQASCHDRLQCKVQSRVSVKGQKVGDLNSRIINRTVLNFETIYRVTTNGAQWCSVERWY
jgi:hypothetical protein